MNYLMQCAISDIIITFSNLYLWVKLLNKKLNLKSIKTYIIIISMYAITLLNYIYNNKYIRIVSITIVMAIFIKLLFNEKFNKSLLTSIFEQLLYMISEIVFIALISFSFKLVAKDIQTTQFGTISANLIISLLAMGLVNIKFIKKIYYALIKITNKIKDRYLILMCMIIVLIANILAMITYYRVDFSYLLIFNTLLTLFYFLLIFTSFRNKNNYIKVYDKYNTTLNSLKEYEKMLDNYRISNHETKNELLTIRNMLSKSNKKAISYIDNIINNNIKDNDKIMKESLIIPEGGLRGLLYSKLLIMKQNNINYTLNVSNKIKTTKLINNLDDSLMLDICQVIGVYADNAIDCVSMIEEKTIDIQMYIEKEELIISITNNFKGFINLEKIEENGYTTKGDNHGYGLYLTKQIIENNNRLINEKKINNNYFTQILKIKM